MDDYKNPGVVTVMYDDMGVFLSERINCPSFQGKMQAGGGGVEKGENILEAALRELKEEAGLTVSPLRLLYIGCDRDALSPTRSAFPLHYFILKLESGESPKHAEPHMHGPWIRYSPKEARKLDLMPGLTHPWIEDWVFRRIERGQRVR